MGRGRKAGSRTDPTGEHPTGTGWEKTHQQGVGGKRGDPQSTAQAVAPPVTVQQQQGWGGGRRLQSTRGGNPSPAPLPTAEGKGPRLPSALSQRGKLWEHQQGFLDRMWENPQQAPDSNHLREGGQAPTRCSPPLGSTRGENPRGKGSGQGKNSSLL